MTMYVKDGKLHSMSPVMVLVSGIGELGEAKKRMHPGSIAYTSGFDSMWQLDANGNWIDTSDGANTSVLAIVGVARIGQAVLGRSAI